MSEAQKVIKYLAKNNNDIRIKIYNLTKNSNPASGF